MAMNNRLLRPAAANDDTENVVLDGVIEVGDDDTIIVVDDTTAAEVGEE